MFKLVNSGLGGWSILIETGDALISRSRSIAVSRWLREVPDSDVCVMTDDDFKFSPEAAESVVTLTREKEAIVAGVTPLRSGEYTAIVPMGEAQRREDGSYIEPWTDPTSEPVEIKWAGGFIGYHRKVFETLCPTLPLLHKDDPMMPAFWPFFMPAMATARDGRGIYLSEDYACHERARQAGFKVWVQPKAQIGHVGSFTVKPQNMSFAQHLVDRG